MKIKNFIITIFTLVSFVTISSNSNAQVTWGNSTGCYYVGVFISGPCPLASFTCPLSTSGYYYDVPNNYSWTDNGPGLIDQGGNYQSPSDINGMCLKDINTGMTYFINFCTWGPTGTVTFPAPNGCGGANLNIYWDITVSPAVVKIW